MDQNCSRGNQPANSTVAKSQGNVMKDLRLEKPKIQGTEPLSGPQRFESFKKAQKKKKKEQHWRDQKHWESSTPATSSSTAQAEPYQKKKKKRLDKAPHDISQVKYFNYLKMSYYANTYPNQPKN